MKLTTQKRNSLPKSDFGEPGKKAYPMPDEKHAQLAKAFASRFASPTEKAKIDTKANKVLKKK